MADSNTGRRLHLQAELAREAGRFLEALEYTDKATIAYENDGDIFGLAEIQSSRQSTFKHLYRSTGDRLFSILEKHAAESAVEIAQKCDKPQALAIPYHNLGKYYAEVEEWGKAAEYFRKAVENLTSYPQNSHSRPSVIADIEGHRYTAEYKCGDKTALIRALKALEDLKTASEDSYNKAVWITGAHLRIAEMLLKDNPRLSKEHLEAAGRIIEKDSRLILRKDQLKKLQQLFK
ncbi:hypothetical protein A3C23_04670 [Candidatus Roizmanbacteria bacterium RIFCSPHIGHO2_02_FULL_37_13b]|uniref:Uncharacterized protein n=1 Tax=Candidatus Roizmanbacteria bacterium RIFCSPLOWO2_02_FULL_36_11 TaxID=1802071 RepID=A0A1F7JHB6_9BACT|nr:MAG: hypothetical protein A3C23_04670 [Candidatus Roizmanbacteria bacterium RIFCSPHIGHO2_02_FULL_37_13b]OGK55001.1 MAG: hypothetical protein A3H78_00815 [Candidatus Roizmanbacteria bacterium RIFCSPLOWO2_02_FULL_36_11]